MKRCKKFIVTFLIEHESYNGYTHKDGERSFEVEAINSKSAEKKAHKLFNKEYSHAYWIKYTSMSSCDKTTECNKTT